MATELLFVGSLNREAPYFQGARGKGLSVYRFDAATLNAELLAETTSIDNPTFLSATPDGRFVYANSEVFGWHEGLVSAFRFDAQTSTLAYLNTQPSLGSITAHNCLTRDGRHLLVANYGIGGGGPDRAVAVYERREDGSLTPALDSISLQGSGPDAQRQERSHAHSFTETVQGGVAILADLGTDFLTTFAIGANGALSQMAQSALPPGSGPRHVALHPNGRLVFVMNELASTVVSLSLDADGRLTVIDTQPAVPEDARATNHCADIQISPDGRFLYGSNRGHDSIAIFAVDSDTGRLTARGHVPCGGATPRNLALNGDGSLLFSANQNADRVSIFRRDAETGALSDSGASIAVGTPMCIKVTADPSSSA